MIRVIEAGGRVKHQAVEALARDRGDFSSHPSAHGMTNKMRSIRFECRQQAEVMNDQVLHTPDVRGRATFAEARVERQIYPKPVGERPRPLMALDRSRSMKRYDRRSLANCLYDCGYTVDVKRERIEFHSVLPFLA